MQLRWRMIVAVLVVPAEGDPGGLLAQGLFWAMPPIAYNSDTCGHPSHTGWREHDDIRWPCYMCQHPTRALVLWWDGALVPEGWDRARRVIATRSHQRWPDADVSMLQADDLACGLVTAGLASRVVRLTRDDSGKLIEVTK